jgi:hypothetical protein
MKILNIYYTMFLASKQVVLTVPARKISESPEFRTAFHAPDNGKYEIGQVRNRKN